MFSINWHRDWNDLTLDYHDDGLWVYITRSNRYTNGSVTVPLSYTECFCMEADHDNLRTLTQGLDGIE